jgi:lipopolysaccharide/colanic/teichoic acid biosynthesis glycosyltransferase
MTRTGGKPGATKRCFDLVVSGLALLSLSPVLLAVGLAVRLDSPGPILFRQVRIGLGGRPFTLLKFRTMIVGADRMAANVSASDDPRVTRCGRFLRRWYLDELPQLVNVLKGELSLVGPRPETPEFVDLYTESERRLLTVRPGLVGPSTLAFMDEAAILAQAEDPVSFYRTTLVHSRATADLQYLELRSFGFDVGVLFRQLARILRRIR